MKNAIIEVLTWGFAAGLLGVVYRYIIAKEETFSFWWKFGNRYERKWFFKPVWSCSHCFAGQFAMWTYFLLKILPALINAVRVNGWLFLYSVHYAKQGATGLFCLIIVTASAIFTAKIISFHFEKNQI